MKRHRRVSNMRNLDQTYRARHLVSKEPQTENKADDNADTRREVLGDIVRIVDAQAGQHATDGLENNRSPYN